MMMMSPFNQRDIDFYFPPQTESYDDRYQFTVYTRQVSYIYKKTTAIFLKKPIHGLNL